MKPRFGRRRRQGSPGRETPIDPAWLPRVVEAGLVSVAPPTSSVADSPDAGSPDAERAGPGDAGEALAPVERDDLSPALARVGRASDAEGRPLVVSVSPDAGEHAILAGLAVAGGEASVVAVTRRPGLAALRLLGVLAEPGRVRLAQLGEDAGEAAPARPEPTPFWPLWPLAGPGSGPGSPSGGSPAARALHLRALAALEGLAAKHGGALRGADGVAELAVLARRVATLRAEGADVVLEVLDPVRETVRLDEAGLADALDRLEGHVRKRLNDRRVRDGEEGLRGRVLAAVAGAAGARGVVRWPLGGGDLDVIDFAAVAEDGTPVVAAIRERVDLRALAGLVDATLRLAPLLPALLAGAAVPVRGTRPRLLLAGARVDPAVRSALAQLALEGSAFEIDGGDVRALAPVGAAPRARTAPARRDAPEREETAVPPGAAETGRRAGEAEARERLGAAGAGEGGAGDAAFDESEAGEAGEGTGRPPARRRSRGRRRGRRGGASAGRAEADEDSAEAGGPEAESGESESRFDELSLFDLDLDEPSGGSRRRGRRRGRRGRGASAEPAEGPEGAESEADAAEADEPSGDARRRGRRRGRGRRGRDGPGGGPSSDPRATGSGDESDDAEEDLDEELIRLAEAPELDEAEVPAYEDEEDEAGEPGDADPVQLERERRRRARAARSGEAVPHEADEEDRVQALPRGRAAILAHADRDSIAAAVLLARDWRQVEGLWIYPQEELMTFFRSVATDLRENSPILIVGFEPHPAREVLQAAALYRGRIAWFDHHAWPPEDEGAMIEAIGADHVHLEPGLGTSLPSVAALSTRRSRFTDKLVDLLTGRFTAHDYQRWGGLWWWRLDELAAKPGERRADVEPLLVGRPSDLAREAARVAPPPPPRELAFVESRDFRLVHFGGLGLSVVEVPPDLDLHLTARLVRERYASTLSVGRVEGGEVISLAADDVTGRRAVDVGAMVVHLAEKFEWVQALPDADFVARLRVRELAEWPERLDEVIAEIGMGRSILEG